MRARLILAAFVLVTLSGCMLGELLSPTPPCPKRIAFDTLGWVKLSRNGVAYDSAAVTGNEREVCTTTRYTARVVVP